MICFPRDKSHSDQFMHVPKWITQSECDMAIAHATDCHSSTSPKKLTRSPKLLLRTDF